MIIYFAVSIAGFKEFVNGGDSKVVQLLTVTLRPIEDPEISVVEVKKVAYGLALKCLVIWATLREYLEALRYRYC